MSTFLLLVGLSLFVSGAAMYLAHAARNDPRWVAGSLVFPFMVPLYYRRYWDELRIAGLLQSAGLGMTVAGALILLVQAGHPDGLIRPPASGEVFSTQIDSQGSGFVDSDRALRLLSRRGPGVQVGGRLHGERFHPDRIELIDGTLRLSEGSGFVPRRELMVNFNTENFDPTRRLKRAIGPGDANAPEIFLTWRDADGNPVTEVFRSGYRLEIELAPLVRTRLSGYIQLMLPDRWESYVAGDISVYTSHLRYIGDKVDRHFDHEDTLRFIADEYLRARYNEGDIDTVTFSNLVLDPLEGKGEILGAVTLKDGRVGHHVVLAAKNEFGWSVQQPESAAATAAAGYRDVYSVLPPGGLLLAPAPVERPVEKPVRKAAVERELPFDQLGSFAGQGAVVELRDGRREQGVLRGMRKDRLVVETMKSGGVVEYLVSASELARLRLNSGEVIRMPGVAATAAPVRPAATASAPAASAAPIIVGGFNLTPYLNRSVKVVTKSGKTTFGVLRGVNGDRLVVETLVGGGKVDYTVPADQLQSIDYASQ